MKEHNEKLYIAYTSAGDINIFRKGDDFEKGVYVDYLFVNSKTALYHGTAIAYESQLGKSMHLIQQDDYNKIFMCFMINIS